MALCHVPDRRWRFLPQLPSAPTGVEPDVMGGRPHYIGITPPTFRLLLYGDAYGGVLVTYNRL